MSGHIKVLLLAETWAGVGGVQRYLRGVKENLGIEVKVLSPQTRRFFWPVIRPAWLPLFIYLWRKAKRKEFEVLLCGKALFEGLAGYYLKKHLGVPYVVFTYAMEISVWSRDEKVKRKMQRSLLNADRVVYINEITKRHLRELGVKEERLIKVQPGVEFEKHKFKSTKHKQRYVLSVGRLIPRKGFDTLIEAFSQLDQVQFGDVELWIAGDGPDLTRLEQAAEDSWINKSVKFLGDVPDERLQELYAGAEVFAMTPREIDGDFEGFGMVYLEAAAHGVPSVGTKTGGVPEAVTNERTGILVEPNNPNAAAVALMRLLANNEQRERMGRQAQLRAQESFSWEEQIAPLRRALQAL